MGLEVIDSRDPVDIHGGALFFGVFAAVAFDLDDELEQVVGAVAVVHEENEIRQIGAGLGTVAIWHLEAEVVVFV
jgi:hypothetical protein